METEDLDGPEDAAYPDFAFTLQHHPRVISARPSANQLVLELLVPRKERSRPVPFVAFYKLKENTWTLNEAFGDASQLCSSSEDETYWIGPDHEGTPGRAIWNKQGGSSASIEIEFSTQIRALSIASSGLIALISRDSMLAGFDSEAGSISATMMEPLGFQGFREEFEIVVIKNGEKVEVDSCVLTKAVGGTAALTGQCAISDDGEVAAVGVTRVEASGERHFGLVLFSTTVPNFEVRVHMDLSIDLTEPITKPDSQSFVCLGETIERDGGPSRQMPVLIDWERADKAIYSGLPVWLVPQSWIATDTLVCLGLEGGRRKAWKIDFAQIDPTPTAYLHNLEGSISSLFANGRQVALVRSGINIPPEALVFLDKQTGQGYFPPTIYSPARDAFPGGLLERHSILTDVGDLGAWMCLPNQSTCSELPVVILCHGGPASSWADWSWRWNPWIFVEQGYAVVMIDPPLSLGYGEAAHRTGWGRWSYVVSVAVRQIVSLLTDKRLDDSRIAVMGASFGGWLALALSARLPNVRLVVAHAGWSDHRAVARSSDLYWHWLREYGPLTAETYDSERTDLRMVSKTTSALISHGALDWHVPVSEALGIARELSESTRSVEVRIFSEEAHALRAISNIVDWSRWVLRKCVYSFQKSDR